MEKKHELRVYDPEKCAVFSKAQEKFGGLGNMAGGFPILINGTMKNGAELTFSPFTKDAKEKIVLRKDVTGIFVKSSETIYQASRYPSNPEIQQRMLNQHGGYGAKLVGKPFRETHTREDWKVICVKLMRWSLRAKLLHNWENFSRVLLETEQLTIVERSRKDPFWGALTLDNFKKNIVITINPPENVPEGNLIGYNILGRLLQELRENVKSGQDVMSNNFTRLEPLAIEKFLLLGKQIKAIVRV
jgi:predicted NAD-dependent protein-ADP-ribosyltransferase YbiA (DUF1768 family)